MSITKDHGGIITVVDVGESSDEEDSDINIADTIRQLCSVEDEIKEVNRETREMLLEINREANEEKKILYAGRNEEIKKVPYFWLQAMLGHPNIADLFNEHEQKCLPYLTGFEVDDFEDDPDSHFIIHFFFKVNPYFQNKTLSKEFCRKEGDDPWEVGKMLSESTKIQWKRCNNVKLIKDMMNKKKHGNIRGKRKANDSSNSFFWWFEQKSHLTSDVFMRAFKDELWPNALYYYLEMIECEEEKNESNSGMELATPVGDDVQKPSTEDDDIIEFVNLSNEEDQETDFVKASLFIEASDNDCCIDYDNPQPGPSGLCKGSKG